MGLLSAVPQRVRHLGNPYQFLSAVCGYQMGGRDIALATAMILPFLQLIIAVALVLRIYYLGSYDAH